LRITRRQLRGLIREQIEDDLLQESVFQDVIGWIKEKGKAAKDSTVDFLMKLKIELEETAEGTEILAKIVMGQTLSAEERTALKTQVMDIGKGLPLLGLIALPGGGIATMALLKLAEKFGIDLMPTAFQP
tara:strand:- start:233 stop:622 length:390 start_codon:yes stop_codon:yes gene_type:complete